MNYESALTCCRIWVNRDQSGHSCHVRRFQYFWQHWTSGAFTAVQSERLDGGIPIYILLYPTDVAAMAARGILKMQSNNFMITLFEHVSMFTCSSFCLEIRRVLILVIRSSINRVMHYLQCTSKCDCEATELQIILQRPV